MSAALRRLPVLARRSAGAAWPAARGAAPALAAMGAGRQGRHLATLPALARAFQPSVQLLQQRRQWPRLQLSARSFSADVQPEGDAVEEVAVAAEPEPVAELPAPPPANRLFVHNIAWATTDEDLAEHFATVGTVVSARVMRDRETGQARGFGFVEMESDAAAAAAIDSLHSTMLNGRELQIKPDQGRAERAPRQERAPREYGDRRERGQYGDRQRRPSQYGDRPPREPSAPDTRVVVHGLPQGSFNWQDLKDLAKRVLAESGSTPDALRRADVRSDPQNPGRSRGWGMLHMATAEDAQRVIEALNGSTLDGRVVSAKLDEFVGGRGRQDGQHERYGRGGARRQEGRFEDE